jgi:hypothetical protein
MYCGVIMSRTSQPAGRPFAKPAVARL